MRYRKHPEWLEAGVNEEMLMMHAESGKFVSLNETGTYLWSRMDEARDEQELAADLHREFEVDETQARADVATWIEQMKEHDVIEPVGD